ncbi:MAG: SDR family NAD(P)-dependent oxidoreductase [Acidimicrobiales bacterium]
MTVREPGSSTERDRLDPVAARHAVARFSDPDHVEWLLPRSEPLDLSGLVTVVTGAGHGIGTAIAHALARGGATVGMVDIDPALLEEAMQAEGRLDRFVADIANPDEGPGALEQVARKYGRLDAVVNNAGLVHADPFLDVPYETWRRVMHVNADGAFLMTQTAGRIMRTQPIDPGSSRRGLIINVSSMAAEFGRATLSAYGASKAALNHLSKSAAIALAPYQVQTTVVYPGNIREGMWGRLGEMIAKAEGRTPEEVDSERVFQGATEFASIVADVLAYPGFDLNGALVAWDRSVLPL